jgi:hypothetical protein
MLILEIAAGIVLGVVALVTFAVWPREVLYLLGGLIFVALCMIEPGLLVIAPVLAIVFWAIQRHNERRCQLIEEETRKEVEASESARKVARLAELEAAQKVRTLNPGEWYQYEQLKREQ